MYTLNQSKKFKKGIFKPTDFDGPVGRVLLCNLEIVLIDAADLIAT